MPALIGAQAMLAHGVGVPLAAGRAAHAWGLSHTAGASPGRVDRMVMSTKALSVIALVLITCAILPA